MQLPEIFAIYWHNTQTFQLLESEFKDQNYELKSWTPPFREKNAAKAWKIGQEWYVEPIEKNKNEINIYQDSICDRVRYWWPLNHRLVWSNYDVHSRRFSYGEETWAKSPSIPILEIQSGIIYPRVIYGFYPRWAASKPKDLETISHSARACLEQHYDSSRDELTNLRITTPRVKNEIDIDDESYYGIDDNSKCISTISILTMIFAFTGLYTYLIANGVFY